MAARINTLNHLNLDVMQLFNVDHFSEKTVALPLCHVVFSTLLYGIKIPRALIGC
jgi:hypothetical protein